MRGLGSGSASQRQLQNILKPGTVWTPAELNHILKSHVVDDSLTTIAYVEWETEFFRGEMRARCCPMDMQQRQFHGFNPKVYYPCFQIISLFIHIGIG
jgi:hypothetical protein